MASHFYTGLFSLDELKASNKSSMSTKSLKSNKSQDLGYIQPKSLSYKQLYGFKYCGGRYQYSTVTSFASSIPVHNMAV